MIDRKEYCNIFFLGVMFVDFFLFLIFGVEIVVLLLFLLISFFILFILDFLDFDEDGMEIIFFCNGGLLFIIDVFIDFVILGWIFFFFWDFMMESFFISFCIFVILYIE